MEIRLVKKEELGLLQQFLNDYWKKDHILATNKALLDYQHFNGYGYNFVVGIENGKIYTALGFVPTQQYDPEIKPLDIWLCIWCKTPDCPKGLGTKLLDFLEEGLRPRTIGAVGINDTIEQLYLKRGWVSGVANHYYLPFVDFLARWEETEEMERVHEAYVPEQIPAKSAIYVNTRYLLHPFYQYTLYSIRGCYFVVRKINNGKASILRIVDIYGELPENIQYAFNRLLYIQNAQYIDCVNYGIPKESFLRMGMLEKPDNLIIPNWTEPWVMEHKPVKFAYKPSTVERVCGEECWTINRYRIFKADADQDRNSIL